ncbi:MAG: phosphoribosylformylglycinamidine synthase subunit PurQ, partial [Methylococcales bacterium]|nr:phosphoribosylformylglycinamidine synthase subunit PurQ [Methylococcales bacterium]
MEERPGAILLKFPGTNCDEETARALETAGFETKIVPISSLVPETLVGASLVVSSGGFSYGDYVMAGRLAKLVTEQKIGATLRDFRDNGGYLLGICNGFQILTQLSL